MEQQLQANRVDLTKRRQEIIDRLNQPNYQELVKMEELNLTWEQLKEKFKIPVYK
jgi:hypothetical protein